MRCLGLFLLVIFFTAPLIATADNAATPAVQWSKPVHGLQARLYTMPSTEPEFDKTYDVWIEFQEVGVETSLGVEHKAVTIRYVSDNSQFQLAITDGKGNALSQSAPPPAGNVQTGDQVVTPQDLVIPPKGYRLFPIAYGGSSPHHPPPGAPTPKGRLLVIAPGNEWLIPPDGTPFHLAVSFVVSTQNGQFPNATPYHGWQGTLELPSIVLPVR
jgi:hypothetical protein